MPTYEYECKTCGTVFDVFQSIKAKPLKQHECPECGRMRPVVRRIGAGGALLFKGSGFYTTDYRGEGYKKAAKAETESGKPAESGEKKPAAGEPAAKDSAASAGKSETAGKKSSKKAGKD